MGCGATAGRHEEAIAAQNYAVYLPYSGDEVGPDARADALQQEALYNCSGAWADPSQPGSAQISLGGEWYYQVSEDAWYPFGPEISAQLLVAWYCGETYLEYTAGDYTFDVDFANCLQTERTTGWQQRIGWVSGACPQTEALEQPQQPPERDALQQPPAEGASDYQWMEYTEDEQQRLLAAWASGQNVIYYSHQGCDFEIDFARMVETNLTTGEQRLLGIQVVDEPEPLGPNTAAALTDTKEATAGRATDQAFGGSLPAATHEHHAEPTPSGDAGKQRRAPPEQKGPTVVPDGRCPINTQGYLPDSGKPGPDPVTGRPRTYVFRATPSHNRPPKREKKWSLAPGQQPRVAGKAGPQAPRQQWQGRDQQSEEHKIPRQGPAQQGPQRQQTQAPASPKLPVGVEWPNDLKARRVAETLFRDMAGTKSAALDQRRQAYRAACLSWHPDKNPKHQELATDVFQFLQALKGWYFGV